MSKKETQLMPYSLEAEKCLLGSILIDREYQLEIVSKLTVDDFYVPEHKLVFETIQSMLANSKPVDVITVEDEMSKTSVKKPKNKNVDISSLAETLEQNTALDKIGGIKFLTELATSIVSSSNFEYYLNIVKRDSTLRKLIRSAEEIIKNSRTSNDHQKAVSFAEQTIYDISETLDTSSLKKAGDSVDSVLKLFENIQKDKDYLQGLNTGFTCYDRATNGLHDGNLIILAARPAVGKSTFAMNIVENVALRCGAVCAVFSLEMTQEELVERMVYTLSGVSNKKARKGELSTEDWKRLWDAKREIVNSNIYIDDTAMTTVPMILSKCRRLKSLKGKLDLVVVDHMQLMNAVVAQDNRQAIMTEISRGLKMIAKELKVPVIALSQLRRLPEGQKPALSDLRESGSIEQDADVVMFIHRPNVNNASDIKDESGETLNHDECLIMISKNRSGECLNFKLKFDGEHSRFVNIVPQNYEVPNNYAGKTVPISDNDVPPESDDVFAGDDNF